MLLLFFGLGACPDGGASRFWLGMLPWIVLFLVVSGWSSRAHRHYLRLYTANYGAAALVPDHYEDSGARQYMTTTRGFKINRRLRAIVWERQEDPALEEARREVVRRWRTIWAVMAVMALFAPVIPGILVPC